MKKQNKKTIDQDIIVNKIHWIRDHKVMLDKDLAFLYGVSTGNLNKAVKRNLQRFPEDFMFRITAKEHYSLRFQTGILEKGKHSKYLPYVFTEQGIAMLSSMLNSERAIQVNIQIIRVYTKMRQFMLTHKEILLKLEKMERKADSHDENIKLIFEYIKKLNPESI